MARRPLSPHSALSRVHQGVDASDSPSMRDAAGQPTRLRLSRRLVSLEHEIAHLRGLDLRGLRARWQSVTGRTAPAHLSRQLLFAVLAYRIQADIMGDLDGETIRLLKSIAGTTTDGSVTSLTDVYDQRRVKLLPGTVLTREWNGQVHRVMVADNGFVFEGQSYRSLSTIAHAITGTKWNGPRFFGMRDRKSTSVRP